MSVADAIRLCAHRRNIEPAVYNTRRLLEKPLGKNPPVNPELGCSFSSQLPLLSVNRSASLTGTQASAQEPGDIHFIYFKRNNETNNISFQHSNNSKGTTSEAANSENNSQQALQSSVTDLATASQIIASTESSTDQQGTTFEQSSEVNLRPYLRRNMEPISQRRHSDSIVSTHVPIQKESFRRLSLYESANVYNEEGIKEEPNAELLLVSRPV